MNNLCRRNERAGPFFIEIRRCKDTNFFSINNKKNNIMPKLTPSELRAIQAEAHKIREQHPSKPWKECVREAGRKIARSR